MVSHPLSTAAAAANCHVWRFLTAESVSSETSRRAPEEICKPGRCVRSPHSRALSGAKIIFFFPLMVLNDIREGLAYVCAQHTLGLDVCCRSRTTARTFFLSSCLLGDAKAPEYRDDVGGGQVLRPILSWRREFSHFFVDRACSWLRATTVTAAATGRVLNPWCARAKTASGGCVETGSRRRAVRCPLVGISRGFAHLHRRGRRPNM